MEFNPVGLDGLEFIEFCGPEPRKLQSMMENLGFTKVAVHKTKNISLFRQNQINFLLNEEPKGFGYNFQKLHGPSVCSTGFRVKDAQKALATASERGARAYNGDYDGAAFEVPAMWGIGESLIYFIDGYSERDIYEDQFEYITDDSFPKGIGLEVIDHLTNNVPYGEMQKWCSFYEDIFNFKERRYFDIKGAKTGLFSKVMRSPCNGITIPINEPDGANTKGQIQEYLDEYKGSGIQHIALKTEAIMPAVASIKSKGINFLATPDTYYEMVNDRVPNVTENIEDLRKHQILVDGDEEGYLLQIFFELITRKNHQGFGDGNFQALFDAIERDQQARGVL
jgi:4-hydroxyphenylpyruvate dioxygenase